MPTAAQILDGLREAANTWRLVSVLWHVYFGVLVIALVSGWRPSKRLAALLLGLPFLSVSAVAWLLPNPFNGLVFALTGLVLLIFAKRLPRGNVQLARGWPRMAGILLFAFGWVYPHFLDTASYLPYLIAAPVGTVPCPTLLVVIGAVMVLDGLGSRGITTFLGVIGLLYGVVGALILRVALDVALILGAALILLQPYTRRPDQAARGVTAGVSGPGATRS